MFFIYLKYHFSKQYINILFKFLNKLPLPVNYLLLDGDVKLILYFLH